MVDPKPFIQLLTIIFALAGAYLVAEIAYATKRRKYSKLLRARVFLNDSFLHDSWKLLFFVCFIFLINATIELNDMLGVCMYESNLDPLKEIMVLGVLACTVMSEYKWLKLIKPEKPLSKAKRAPKSREKQYFHAA